MFSQRVVQTVAHITFGAAVFLTPEFRKVKIKQLEEVAR
jgi:hypothetical protein